MIEVRTTGSDTNSGGFRSGGTGTDWSQQDAAQYSVTDGVTAGTTTITSATANFGTDVVHNLIYVQGGTGSVVAGWYEITARTNSTTITVDRSTGLTTGTGVTLKIGGALASPGLAAVIAAVSDMKVWIKSGTYNISTSTPGAAGPVVSGAIRLFWRGYQATRGDHTGTRPVLTWTAASPGSQTYIFATSSGLGHLVENIAVDGAGVANVSGFNVAGGLHRIQNCVATNCSGTSMPGIRAVGQSSVIGCKADTCAIGFLNPAATNMVIGCAAIACGVGFSGGNCFNCLAHASTTSGFDANTQAIQYFNCTADGTSSGPGFQLGTASVPMVNCLATNNSTYGIDASSGTSYLFNIATYNNTSGRVDTTPFCDEGAITLSADPYVSLAGDDLRPNTTSGGGAALRALAIGVFGQTDNRDVGAVQHSDPSGGGGLLVHPAMAGGV